MTILPLCPQKQPIRDVDRADHPSSILIISVSCSLTDTIDARRFPSSELHGMRIVWRGYAATHILHRVDSGGYSDISGDRSIEWLRWALCSRKDGLCCEAPSRLAIVVKILWQSDQTYSCSSRHQEHFFNPSDSSRSMRRNRLS